MNRLMAVTLSEVLLVGLTVSSQAFDWQYRYLPARGIVGASLDRLSDVLKKMGGQGDAHQGERGVRMVWDPPTYKPGDGLYLTPWREVKAGNAFFTPPNEALKLDCITRDDPPAAETLCKEIERRYLQER